LNLNRRYENDLNTWNRCAKAYEQAIVLGHPEVCAYEAFEEDFLDALLLHLIRDLGIPVRLFDVGCGSARLHLRYGLKTAPPESLESKVPLFAFDPVLASGLSRIDGLDFSQEMLEIAREKLIASGLDLSPGGRIGLRQGSAFDLAPEPGEGIPVAVAVCNTLGVIQGPKGAQLLFQAMRRFVESQGGIALISAYRKDAVASYALGNYESTMNVSGQPRWLKPWRFTDHNEVPVPLEIKRAFDPKPSIRVAVQNQAGEIIEECQLERDPEEVQRVISTGHIRTLWDYESHWYSMRRVRGWMREHWSGLPQWHVPGRAIDRLRGEPAQWAILDAGGRLDAFLTRLNIRKGA
jgi:SAM-dependent methyltransferase